MTIVYVRQSSPVILTTIRPHASTCIFVLSLRLLPRWLSQTPLVVAGGGSLLPVCKRRSTAVQNSWGFIWLVGDSTLVASSRPTLDWSLFLDISSIFCSSAATRWTVSSVWGPRSSLLSPSRFFIRLAHDCTSRSMFATLSSISCRPFEQPCSAFFNLPTSWSIRLSHCAVIRVSMSCSILLIHSLCWSSWSPLPLASWVLSSLLFGSDMTNSTVTNEIVAVRNQDHTPTFTRYVNGFQ